MYKNYKYKIIIVSVIQIMFLFSQYALAQSDKKASIALITDKTSGVDKSPLVSLLEVELSQRENIKLLERAAIDTIFEEQKLSAAGLLDRNTTIKIGKLLRADAFIILSLESQSQESGDLIRVRVTETAHGLRLLDFFEQSDSNSVESIVQELESVLKKINQPNEKLIPVGIVDIHRVQLDEQYKMLERTLPTLLSSRLSLEPQIVMLEREDLKVLLDEKLMTEGEDTEFWNSAILIDGYIQSNNGQLEMHLNLKQSSGDNLKSFVVQVEPNEPVEAISKATTEIILQLQNSPPTTKWNPEQEAEQYYKKAQLLIAHERYEEAVPLLETTNSLQPQNVYYTGAMFEIIWDEYRNRRGNYTDLEIAEMASVFVRQIRDDYNKGIISIRDIYKGFAEYLGTGSIVFGTNEYFINQASVATRQIKQINKENREIYIETFRKALQNQLFNPMNPEINLLSLVHIGWISSDEPSEIMNNMKRAFNEYVLSPEYGGKLDSIKERERIFERAFLSETRMFNTPNFEMGFLKGRSEEFLKLWDKFIWGLAENDDIFISSKGAVAISQGISFRYEGIEKEKAKKYVGSVIEKLVDEFTNTESSLDKTEKDILLSYIRFILGDLFSIDDGKKRLILDKICDYLITQKDAINLVEIGAHLPNLGLKTPGLELWRKQFLEKVAIALQTNENLDKVNIHSRKTIEDNLGRKIQFVGKDSVRSYALTGMDVSILINKKDWPKMYEFYEDAGIEAVVKDDMLWIALSSGGGKTQKDSNGNTFYPTEISIAKINLVKKEVITTWQISVSTSHFMGVIKNLIIKNDTSYIAVEYGGIIEFTNNIGKSQNINILTTENSLPSSLITSIAQKGGKLWVAYGDDKKESGLGIYDPESEEWETVFCSTLQGEPPFSNGQSYKINSILSVSSDKLFFIVSGLDKSAPWNSDLWKMDINSYKMNFIRQFDGDFISDLHNNIWIRSSSYLVTFEPVSESMKLVIRNSNDIFKKYPNRKIPLYGLEEDLFVPEMFLKNVNFAPLVTEGDIDLSNSAIHNNCLWTRFGQNQIIIAEKGKSFEEAQIIDNDILDGEPVYKFVSTPYGLVGIGEGVVGLIETED